MIFLIFKFKMKDSSFCFNLKKKIQKKNSVKICIIFYDITKETFPTEIDKSYFGVLVVV